MIKTIHIYLLAIKYYCQGYSWSFAYLSAEYDVTWERP
jgi:hypothetical protein